jgi:hypothetical protein
VLEKQRGLAWTVLRMLALLVLPEKKLTAHLALGRWAEERRLLETEMLAGLVVMKPR